MGFDEQIQPPDDEDHLYPNAPLPAHERQWRHPSELGSAAPPPRQTIPVDIGPHGRGLLGFGALAATLLLIGLIIIIRPKTGDTNPFGVLALSNSDLHVASLVPSLNHPEAMAIILADGQILVTTMSAVADLATVEILLPSGQIETARVLYTHPDTSIAILSMYDPEDNKIVVLPLSHDFITGQMVTALVDKPQQLLISDPIDKTTIALKSILASDRESFKIIEGAPLIDHSGRLVGICTYIDGDIGFIPISQIKKGLASLSAGVDNAVAQSKR